MADDVLTREMRPAPGVLFDQPTKQRVHHGVTDGG
jgi:hypothetical protein